jgi:hypothetical protein
VQACTDSREMAGSTGGDYVREQLGGTASSEYHIEVEYPDSLFLTKEGGMHIPPAKVRPATRGLCTMLAEQ